MFPKPQNSLNQFDKFNTRLKEFVVYNLDLPQFLYSLSFEAPEDVIPEIIEDLARATYDQLPQHLSWSRKYLLTLKAITDFIEANY